MTEEEKNKEKRKTIPLTTEEYLTFFFFPYNDSAKGFNDSEDKRFKKYGFHTKLQQAKNARILGTIFYAVLFFIIVLLLKKYHIV